MTVSTTNAMSGPYTANGVTTAFPFTFKAMTPGEIRVTRVEDDVETELSRSLYSVSLASNGGTVTFASAPASGQVYVYSDPLYTQELALASGQPFSPRVVSDALDRAAVRDQDLLRRSNGAVRAPVGETIPALPRATERAGSYLAFDAGGAPVAASGTGADDGLRTDLAAADGAGLVWGAALAIRPTDFGAVDGLTTDQTSQIEATFAAALASGIGRIDGGGATYYVSFADVTVSGNLIVDNMTLVQYAPNTGSPIAITFTAQTAGAGSLYLGPNFRVNCNGDGTAGDLNTACGIYVADVGRVEAYAEVFGNIKGTGIIVDRANLFLDHTYVHDIYCDMTGVTDDTVQGSWARFCENVVTRGLVKNLGNIDRTSATRDAYTRGRVYSGCKNIDMGGTVGPGVSQNYDVTGDAANGNSNVKLNSAHAAYPLYSGFKFANAVLGVGSGTATCVEPGLCSVLVSGPTEAMMNMTSGVTISGITQIGGGANQVPGDPCAVVWIGRQNGSLPMAAYPQGVHITGNTFVQPGGPDTFTVSTTDTLLCGLTAPLNVHTGARVRLTTSGTLPNGLATATDYWIILVNGNKFKLATSFINAQDGVAITGLSGGSGTHTVTVQRDCNYGAISEVTDYVKTAPNLVYSNNFGTLISRHANIKPLRAELSNSGAQSITSGSATAIDADTKTDPYGFVVSGGGYIEVTFPIEGNWRIYCNGEWATGGSGIQSTRLRLDTGSGFADVQGYFETQPNASVVQRQTLQWDGHAYAGTKARIEVSHNSGSPKDYSLKLFTVECLPG